MMLARFRPRLLDIFSGYSGARLGADLSAGLTVGIVALPLAMAFAIASGLKPEAGLWCAIIAGFLCAVLGGSNVQIGGPAGAFIVVVYGIVERHGVANLLLCTMMAGLLLFGLGLLRLGSVVRYVPISVVIGFTHGIAVLILCSQLRDWWGLQTPKMPASVFGQLQVLAQHLGSLNFYAFALGCTCIAGLALWPRLWAGLARRLSRLSSDKALSKETPKAASAQSPRWLTWLKRLVDLGARLPGPFVAVLSLSLLAYALALPVETIGTRFGGIPQGLPSFALPDISWAGLKPLLMPALTLALLGAIESLLCARISDHATAPPVTKHDPNQELMAQGLANFFAPCFGAMPATGTLARSVTNARLGASSPIAAITHAVAILLVVLVAAPLAVHIPLSVLAGLLVFVAWNMIDWPELARLRRFSYHYRVLLLGTFLLTIVFDITVAVQAGVLLACVLFVRRISTLFRVVPVAAQPGELRYELHGALFFGTVDKLDELLDASAQAPTGLVLVLDVRHLYALDTSGVDVLRSLHQALQQRGIRMRIESAPAQAASLLERSGLMAELAASNPSPSPAPAR